MAGSTTEFTHKGLDINSVHGESRILNARHYKECVEKRGLDAQWVTLNCSSTKANVASQRLGYTAQSDGIWLEGCNHQSQFKPDKPWKSEGDKKAPKYRSPLGEYDAILPTHPTDPNYWDDIEALKREAYKVDGHPCLVITEGFFKALAGCSNGIPTIALLGVEMGLTPSDADPQGKRYLVPTLERYALAGFGFILGFDSDCTDNKNVLIAQRKLAHQLRLFKVPLYSITGLWTVAEGKGMDDYIQAHGSDRFKREVMGKTVDIKSWEKQFQQKEVPKTGKIPPADTVAHELADQYKDQLAFNNEIGRWMRYGADSPGMWSLETDEYIEAIVGGILDGKNITGYGSHSYLTNVVKTLRRLLIVRKWNERSAKDLLPFQNGVLEVSTGKLLEHSPGYRLTWQLPRDHDSKASDWSGIDTFLDHLAGGNAAIKDVLLCYCNAVLKGRSDLQKFLHLIGLGGTGKGTFARLITDLIGADNIYSSTLDGWCSNRFESANAYRKRLVVFWDEDKQSGKLGRFLSLTGDDLINAEEKGKKAFQYRYDGMVLVLSNLPIFTGDAVSRVARRVITVPCNNPVPLSLKRDLNAEFQTELDAFTNHVLSLPDAHVTKVLMGLLDIPECTLEFWENRVRTDSIASWINDLVVRDPDATLSIGSNKDEGLDGEPSTAYGSYCLHARQSGTNAKASKNFSPDALELFRSVLGWEVERKATKTGKYFKGVRLRTKADAQIPTYDYQLLQRVTDKVTSGDGSGDGSGCPQHKVKSDCDGSIQTSMENLEVENDFYVEQQELDLPNEVDTQASPKPESPLHTACDLSPSSVIAPVTTSSSQQKQSATESPVPSPSELAAQILQCRSWVAAVEAMDVVAVAINKPRAVVFNSALKHFTVDSRQHLVRLLAAHIQQFPRDQWAYNWLPESSRKLREKAIALALGNRSGEESAIE